MKKTLLLLFAAVAPVAAHGQGAYGTVPQFPMFGISRIHQLSTFETNIATARSAAMGGAFTSLGADLSSMSINPAGLGMYRGSDLGFTIGPVITDRKNSMPGEGTKSGSKTSFAINNFGMAFNIFDGSTSLTSLTVGLGYSRLADYNFRSRMEIANGYHSVLEMFDWQTADGSVDAGTADSWGAFLSWDVGMLDDRYDPYFGAVLSDQASIFKRMNTISRGSAGEYSLAVGWNLRNQFYLGLSIGILDIYQNRETTYSEDYTNNVGVDDPLNYMDYTQKVKTRGSGVNLKLGLVYRPVEELRIGLAYHTPTISNINNITYHQLEAGYPDEALISFSDPQEEYEEDFYTPSRILTGISYTFANRGVVALDYEHTFYNGMGLLSNSDLYSTSDRNYFRDRVKEYFNGANTLRFGAEVMATDLFMLRAGASYTNGGVKKKWQEDALEIDLPVIYERMSVGLGFGVRIGANSTLDLAYLFSDSKMTSHDPFFYYVDGTPEGDIFAGENHDDRISTKQQRHNIMLGMSFRF